MAGINRVSKGLTSMLGAKQFGRNPSEILDTARPVVELSPFLLADIGLRQADGPVEVAAPTFLNERSEVVVPDGQTWAVKAVIANATATATVTSIMVTPAVRLNPFGGATAFAAALTDTPSFVPLPQFHVLRRTALFDEPLVAGPGTRFLTIEDDGAGGTISFVTYVVYYPLDV